MQDSARFTVSGEVRLPRAGKLEVPLMRLHTVERESGGVAVEVLGAGEIKNRQASGLEEAEAADLGQLISSRQSPSLIAFRLLPAEGKSARSLSLEVAALYATGNPDGEYRRGRLQRSGYGGRQDVGPDAVRGA